MPAGTLLLEGCVEILDGRLVLPRVLADLSHHIRLVVHIIPHNRKLLVLVSGVGAVGRLEESKVH